MNEFSSIYQASEDLMDHCVLAETNGNFQEAIRHCSQAIGTDNGKTLLWYSFLDFFLEKIIVFLFIEKVNIPNTLHPKRQQQKNICEKNETNIILIIVLEKCNLAKMFKETKQIALL